MSFATPHTARSSYLKYSSGQQPHPTTARLPEERVKRLQRLIDREEHTRRRDLVKEYIVQRIDLSDQRHKSHAPEARRLVEQTVDHIVDDPSFIFKGKRLISSRSRDILGNLESKLIREIADLNVQPPAARRDGGKKSTPPSTSAPQLPALQLNGRARGRKSQGESVAALLQVPRHRASTTTARQSVPPGTDGGQTTRRSTGNTVLQKIGTWQLIDAFQSFQGQQHEQQQQDIKAKRAEEYRAFLERQKQEQDAKKEKTQAERAKAREEQERLHEKWLVDQEALKHKVMTTNYDEKAKRLVVIEEKNRLREMERTQKLREEKAMIDIYRRLQRDEEQRKHQHKLEERRRQEKIEEENRSEKEKKRMAAAEVALEDQRLMAEYAKKLEKEEEERKASFSKRVVKMQSLGEKWATEGAGKKQQEMLLQQERRTMEAALKKEREDEERERRDREKKARDKKLMADENWSMSRRHMEEQLAAKRDTEAEVQRLRREAQELKVKEMQQKMAKRAKQQEYVDYLRKQMEDGNRLKRGPEISESEKRLNREILEKAESDENFLDYCERQLLPALEGSATATSNKKRS